MSQLIDGLVSLKKYLKHGARWPIFKQYSSLATIAKYFNVIENDQVSIISPYKQGQKIISELNSELTGEKHLIELLQKAQPFLVNVYEEKLNRLLAAGDAYRLNNRNFAIEQVYAFKKEAYKKLVLEDSSPDVVIF